MDKETLSTICEGIGAVSILYGAVKGIIAAVRSWGDRVKKIAISVESEAEAAGRDKTKYFLDDDSIRYGKGRLVLAVVRKFIATNPNCTVEGLKQIFPDKWQGKYLIRSTSESEWLEMDNAKHSHDFFTKDDELLKLKDGSQIAVCRQWGIDNIDAFIVGARGMGFKIVPDSPSGASSGAKATMLCLLTMGVTILSLNIYADTVYVSVNGVQWGFNDSECRIWLQDNTYKLGGDVVVPEYINGNLVKSYSGSSYYTWITSLTFPSSLEELAGSSAYYSFYYWSHLRYFVFLGNAPKIAENFFGNSQGVHPTIYVMPSSTGWGVSIPGTWQGTSIKYLKSLDFDANGGSLSEPTRWVVDDVAIGTLPTPTHPGATFDGWFTAANGGAMISEETTISANTTFYAHWTLNDCMVTFDPLEGVGGSSRVQTYGTNLGALPVPNRLGYLFCGWFTDASGGTQITENTTVDGERTYYAHWERDPIPELTSGETVADALVDSADSMLGTKITTKKGYAAFRYWVDENSLVHKDVKESPNAWLAYALDAPGLIDKDTAVDKDDFQIDKLELPDGITSNCDFTFGLDEVVIGEESELEEVFVVEGSEKLEESSFSTDGLQVAYDRTEDGKVKATITPPAGKTTYFMRVKVK